jgi:hypothetical protein
MRKRKHIADDRLSFESFTVPDFRYFPTHLLEKQGPKQWARFKFLYACQRLRIAKELWPRFQLGYPRPIRHSYLVADTLSIPSYELLYESEAEWRKRAHELLEKLLDKHGAAFRVRLKRAVDDGLLTKIRAVRGTSPLDLRYEWAARHYCLEDDYKEMSSEKYSADRIGKTVRAILREVGLAARK